MQVTHLLRSVLHPVTKTSRHETTVKWRTQSPDFHEQFVYNSGSVDHLAKQSLHLTVWDREKGRPDKYIGEDMQDRVTTYNGKMIPLFHFFQVE